MDFARVSPRFQLLRIIFLFYVAGSTQLGLSEWRVPGANNFPCNTATTVTIKYGAGDLSADLEASSGSLWLVTQGTTEVLLPETVPFDNAAASLPIFIRGEGDGEIQVYDDVRKSTSSLKFKAVDPRTSDTKTWIPRLSIKGDNGPFVVSVNKKATATLTLSGGVGPMPPSAHISVADHRGRIVSSSFYSTFDLMAGAGTVQLPVAGQYEVSLKILNDDITSLPSAGKREPEAIPFGKTVADIEEPLVLPEGVTTQTVVGMRVALEHIPTTASVAGEDRTRVVALARPSKEIQKNRWPFVVAGADLISMSASDQKEKGAGLVRWQRRLGSSFAPVNLEWETIQKSPGFFRWTSLNSVLPIYRKAIVRPLLTLTGKSAWSGELPTETSATLDAWSGFTRQLSEKHRELIWGLQCWKYPEESWAEMKDYGSLVEATLKGFQMPHNKKAPTPPVIIGGTREFYPDYLEPLLTSDTVNRVSGISFDLFPKDEKQSPESNGFAAMLAQAADFARAKNGNLLKLWVTGTGWPNGPDGVTQKLQANYLVRTHVMALSHGVYKLYWNSLTDKSTVPWEDESLARMGLLDSDLFPKASGIAYNLMTYMMSGVEPLEVTRQGEAIIYKFNIPLQNNKWPGLLYVAWTESTGMQDIRLEMTQGGGVYALDYLGAEVQTRKVTEDSANLIRGYYSFPIGIEPVFIWDAGGPRQTK